MQDYRKKKNIQNKVNELNRKITEKETQIMNLEETITNLKQEKDNLININEVLKQQIKNAKITGESDAYQFIKNKIYEIGEIISYTYDDTLTVDQNLESFVKKAKEEIDLKQKEIDYNEEIKTIYESELEQLQEEKDNLLKQQRILEEKIKKKEDLIKNNENIRVQYGNILNQIHQEQVLNVEKKEVLKKERESVENKIKEQRTIIEEAKQKINEANKKILILNEKIKKNNDQITLIKTEKAKLEEDKKALETEKQNLLITKQKLEKTNKDKIAVLKSKEEAYVKKEEEIKKLEEKYKTKEKEIVLKEKEIETKKKELELKEQTINSQFDEVIPKGIDEIENKIIEIIYNIPIDFEMTIKRFREFFISGLKSYSDFINIKLPDPGNNESNSDYIYSKSIYGWYEFYKRRITNFSEHDFNSEGVINLVMRNIENSKVADFLKKLWDENILKNKTEFKKDIIENGIEDIQQKAYFIKRLTNPKIGEGIIGNKTIDGWYTLYLHRFFGGRNEYEEKNF